MISEFGLSMNYSDKKKKFRVNFLGREGGGGVNLYPVT